MEIEGTRFGTIAFEDARVINFPAGLIGFAEETSFVFLEPRAGGSVAWLQSTKTPELAFPVVAGEELEPGYPAPSAVVLAKQRGLLGRDVAVLVVVASRGPNSRVANLLAPIVIDVDARVGAQVVLDAERYSAASPFVGPTRAPEVVASP